MSPIFAMPTTTVAKMIGAIIILIRLMKPSPSGFIASARVGKNMPRRTPMAIATSTWKYRCEYRGLRRGPGCMTIPSPHAGGGHLRVAQRGHALGGGTGQEL